MLCRSRSRSASWPAPGQALVVPPKTLVAAQELLGYRFKDTSLLAEALTHASTAGHRLQSNERMEFLGDAVLGYVISVYLFQHFPTYLEGDLTKVKSTVVSRRVCSLVSQDLGLGAMLSLGRGMAGRPTLPASVAAAVFEAVIAAIFLDGGIVPARKFILKQMRRHIEQATATMHQHNYKSVLQQYAQRHLPTNPLYLLLDEKGPDHSKCFEICVELNGRRFPSAWAKSKKDAEQQAALLALIELGVARRDSAGAVVLTDLDAADGRT